MLLHQCLEIMAIWYERPSFLIKYSFLLSQWPKERKINKYKSTSVIAVKTIWSVMARRKLNDFMKEISGSRQKKLILNPSPKTENLIFYLKIQFISHNKSLVVSPNVFHICAFYVETDTSLVTSQN